MIGMLRKYKTTAMAIDQPIDFLVSESTVMLTVYLLVPEAENTRRAMNTANGIRRAKQIIRKLFIVAVIHVDDYTEMKKEYQTNCKSLKRELQDINNKLNQLNKQRKSSSKPMLNILTGFSDMATTDKKYITNLIPPVKIDFKTGELSLDLGIALSKILSLTVKPAKSYEFYK